MGANHHPKNDAFFGTPIASTEFCSKPRQRTIVLWKPKKIGQSRGIETLLSAERRTRLAPILPILFLYA